MAAGVVQVRGQLAGEDADLGADAAFGESLEESPSAWPTEYRADPLFYAHARNCNPTRADCSSKP
jgi:hypothetical protein